jgi:hypothetical protein
MRATHDLRSVIARYNDAWNAHDIDAILAMHTADSVFENHTSGGRAVGKAEIGKIIAAVFETFPDIAFSTRRLYVGEGFVVQEWTASATFSRPIIRDGREEQPTHRPITWDGVDVIPFEGELVARKDVYVDSLGLRRQTSASSQA